MVAKTLLDGAFGDDPPELGATPADPPEGMEGPVPVPTTDDMEDGWIKDLPVLPGKRKKKGRERIDFYVDADLHKGYTDLLRKAMIQFDCSKGEFQDAILTVALGQPAEIARTLSEALYEVEAR